MSQPDAIQIRHLTTLDASHITALADLLIDCVDSGASVSFLHPLSQTRALAFWHKVAVGVAATERALLVAQDRSGIVGTVQLVLDQPENQPHRADLSKLLVHRRTRRSGVGEALMRAVEPLAKQHGKSLLVLDTASSDAERLYERLEWQRVGAIPGYALKARGGLEATTLYYKVL